MPTLSTLALVFALAAVPGGVMAQDVDPAARQALDTAISAMGSGDLDGALQNYKAALGADPSVQAVDDQGLFDWLLAGMRQQAPSSSGDAAFQRDYGYLLQFAGDYQASLKAYETAKRLDPTTEASHVDQQIRTLKSWVQATESQNEAYEEAYSQPASQPAAASEPPQPSGPDPKDQEIDSLKQSLRSKDEQIEALNKEKGELSKQITDLQKEVKRWQGMAFRSR